MTPMNVTFIRQMRAKKPIPCTMCSCQAIRCRVMLYGDADGEHLSFPHLLVQQASLCHHYVLTSPADDKGCGVRFVCLCASSYKDLAGRPAGPSWHQMTCCCMLLSLTLALPRSTATLWRGWLIVHVPLLRSTQEPTPCCLSCSKRSRVAADDVITPEDVFDLMKEDLKVADLILWVGISFEQSASTAYFRRVSMN